MGLVIFLGTGDSLCAERAQASIAAPLAGDETMLFDASSGTVLLQRLRTAGIPLESVRHLFVTHRHFDHAGGLAPLLVAMVPLRAASITVHALPETLQALRDLLGLTIPGVEDWLGERLLWSELAPGRATAAGDAEVTPFPVDHGLECAGFRVAQGGSTMVYSADTRPCRSVVEYASGAELLVHEAYGPNRGAARAHFLGHSTAGEAGEVACSAGAKNLVLTHLREHRYADPRELQAEAERVCGLPVRVARDLDVLDF
jgi:ribonuclease BN (tRNA processing enzyme)